MKKWIFISIGIIVIIIGAFSIVYLKSINPLKIAEEKAIAAASKEIDLKNIENIEIYNGEETIIF